MPAISAAPLRPAPIKGNSGETARRRTQQKFATLLIGVLLLWVTIQTIWRSYFAGIFVPDIEIDAFGNTKIRRRPQRHTKKYQPEQSTTEMDAALEGYLTLLELSIPANALQGTGTYHGVTAKFCRIDWKLQTKAPHQVPMFRDLTRQSKMCEGTTISVDLVNFVQRAREYDAKALEQEGTTPAVPPTGVVFHESRCGSTLISNLLATLRPEHTRVYSEHEAHTSVLTACRVNPCNPDLHVQLIQDIFYVSGRTYRTAEPRYVFYKISSLATLYLDAFAAALPGVPWVYLYRDTVEVMQSHLVADKLGGVTRSRRNPPCLRLQPTHPQPVATAAVVSSAGRTVSSLGREEYCAAHLGALSLSALQEHDRTSKGAFVNYRQLPGAVWERLLPDVFGVTPTREDVRRMQEASKAYAKDRGRTGDQPFQPDSERKRAMATPAIVEAARLFTGSVYQRLEELSV